MSKAVLKHNKPRPDFPLVAHATDLGLVPFGDYSQTDALVQVWSLNGDVLLSQLAATMVERDEYDRSGRWTSAVFARPAHLDAGTTYALSVSGFADDEGVYLKFN